MQVDKPNEKAILTEGHIGRTLFRLTIPMVVGILGFVVFNLTDTFFVGMLGTRELAALSFTFPVVLVLTRFAHGLGVGASAVISRAVGGGNQRMVRRLTTDSLSLSILLVFLFAVAGLLTIDKIFTLLGASAEIKPLVKQYMTIWYCGLVFVVFPMVSNNAIRAKGDTKTPAVIMLFAVTVNIIMDPVLIFGPGPFPAMGLSGAAVATVIARALTFVLSFYVVHFRFKMITFERSSLREVLYSWKKILYIGLPAAATKVIVPLGIGIITNIVSLFGAGSVAAFGVAAKVEFFALSVIMALSSVLSPFIGQNLGAGKIDRLKKGISYSNRFSFLWGLATFAILALPARQIASVFTRDQEVVSKIIIYLRIVPICYCMEGIFVLAVTALNVMYRPIHAAVLSIVQMFVLCVPLAWLGSRLFGLTGVFSGLAIAHLVTGLIAYRVLRVVMRKRLGI